MALVNDPCTTDLAEGALVLAALADPDVDAAAEQRRLDQLADQCREPTLDGVRRLLFRDLGFTGDRHDYHDPANSLLPSVLDRRRGLPITLSVVMIEVGRRVGAPLDGVGMPGHFLVRDRVLPDVYVDPFHDGAVLDAEGCAALFGRLTQMPFEPSYLEATPAPQILARMVANLVNSYRRRGRRADLLWAARLRARCPGVSAHELVSLADAMAEAAAFEEASDLLERAGVDLPQTEAVAARAQRYRAQLN